VELAPEYRNKDGGTAICGVLRYPQRPPLTHMQVFFKCRKVFAEAADR
jgi:hypothetical protein